MLHSLIVCTHHFLKWLKHSKNYQKSDCNFLDFKKGISDFHTLVNEHTLYLSSNEKSIENFDELLHKLVNQLMLLLIKVICKKVKGYSAKIWY